MIGLCEDCTMDNCLFLWFHDKFLTEKIGKIVGFCGGVVKKCIVFYLNNVIIKQAVWLAVVEEINVRNNGICFKNGQ